MAGDGQENCLPSSEAAGDGSDLAGPGRAGLSFPHDFGLDFGFESSLIPPSPARTRPKAVHSAQPLISDPLFAGRRG